MTGWPVGFSNIWPFATMGNLPNSKLRNWDLNFAKVGSKFYQLVKKFHSKE